jgi:hypothetical protein
MDYSVVVHDGDDGFAAVTRGSYSLFEPTADPEGYLGGSFIFATFISESNDVQDTSRRT